MIYLDHAATTPVLPQVLEAMLPWFDARNVGNPSSVHTQGVSAAQAIQTAREQIAALINAEPSEIFFTSGATESNNAWLRCVPDGAILTTKLEHHSILEPLDYCSRTVIELRPNADGTLNPVWFRRTYESYCPCGRIAAASIMWVNNELGTINPMEEIGEICEEYGIILHTDAAQAAGHTPINVKKCHIDMLTLSGHKFGGPLGVGVLYIRNGITSPAAGGGSRKGDKITSPAAGGGSKKKILHKKPLIYGGGQELGMRGGTENVPAIVGLGKAAELAVKGLDTWMNCYADSRAFFLSELEAAMPGGFTVNGSQDHNTNNIISVTIPGVNSEALLLMLDAEDIYISAGSACSASSSAASHVLRGIGMGDERASQTVRISTSPYTSYFDLQTAATKISEISRKIRSISY